MAWDTSKPGGQLWRWFDISKSKRDLQFVPQTEIRNGLSQTVEWYRANQTNPDLRR